MITLEKKARTAGSRDNYVAAGQTVWVREEQVFWDKEKMSMKINKVHQYSQKPKDQTEKTVHFIKIIHNTKRGETFLHTSVTDLFLDSLFLSLSLRPAHQKLCGDHKSQRLLISLQLVDQHGIRIPGNEPNSNFLSRYSPTTQCTSPDNFCF